MPVLHLISNLDNSGGTIAALNLHKALINVGYDSAVLSTNKLAGVLYGNGYRKFGGISGRIQQAFLKLENLLAQPGFINPVDKWLVKNELEKYNGIIHIHVTHVAQTSFKLINWLAKDKKVFWTLHDLWPLTAKCIHPTYCNKWQKGCYNCPKLEEYPKLNWDNTPNLYKHKWNFIINNQIHFIAPSNWINELTSEKIIKNGSKISTIYHGIDNAIFKPRNLVESRKIFDLPIKANVIFFPQGRWDDKKKGIEWYEKIKQALIYSDLKEQFILLRLGQVSQINKFNHNLSEIILPLTTFPEVMASYYQCANVSVTLSETETFGLCVAESLSCNIPVIGRDAPGVRELINNGLLKNNVDELIELIKVKKWEMTDQQNENNFSEVIWAKKHIDLYEA
ncbi:glycosyltransferase [Pedobacter chinensis]|uniref:Glycosyltransferase n=1 Tax=Pedobacter chinensis TaxID=2282421 RepID=A0A369PVD0_9SPHI|nr:glycosyltransferase [Pedobacter chinensis]RDC56220.1 glycosyltransferase [Pedobacter chinensis]